LEKDIKERGKIMGKIKQIKLNTNGTPSL